MPRCQERNSSFRRRTSSPSLDRVDPVMKKASTPKARTGPGEGYIGAPAARVSGRRLLIPCFRLPIHETTGTMGMTAA